MLLPNEAGEIRSESRTSTAPRRELSPRAHLLATVMRSMPPPRMPPASLALRLKTSPAIRLTVPTRLAVSRAEIKGAKIWQERGGEHDRALETITAIVSGTPRERELTELAREHVIERRALNALYWQPWSAPLLQASARARLRELLDSERGAILSACHVGPYNRSSLAIQRLGYAPFIVSGGWFFEPPPAGYWGRRLARSWRAARRSRLVRAERSFEQLCTLLRAGETTLIYFDLPGRRETPFLGKTATLADGTVRLACECDVPVVPIRARRERHRVWLDVGATLDPRELGDSEQLQQSLARLHEQWILETPAAMEDPREFGWGDGATARAWSRPRSQHAARSSP